MIINFERRPSIMSSLRFQLLELVKSTRHYTRGPKILTRSTVLNLIGLTSMPQSSIKKLMRHMQPKLTTSKMRSTFHQLVSTTSQITMASAKHKSNQYQSGEQRRPLENGARQMTGLYSIGRAFMKRMERVLLKVIDPSCSDLVTLKSQDVGILPSSKSNQVKKLSFTVHQLYLTTMLIKAQLMLTHFHQQLQKTPMSNTNLK